MTIGATETMEKRLATGSRGRNELAVRLRVSKTALSHCADISTHLWPLTADKLSLIRFSCR